LAWVFPITHTALQREAPVEKYLGATSNAKKRFTPGSPERFAAAGVFLLSLP
jgi:hypothetical protein